jgi:hypothetical protein
MGVKLVSASGGSVEINPPATASSFTATMPAGTGNVVVAGINSAIVSGTSQASTSGTSIDFTGIPSWVKRITVMFNGVSTNGTSQPIFQLGDSGGVETTGYTTVASSITNVGTNASAAYTNGWQIYSSAATRVIQGNIVFVLIDSSTNTWSGTGMFATELPATLWTCGTKALSATLDRVRITTVNGTDTFDAGSINILYE